MSDRPRPAAPRPRPPESVRRRSWQSLCLLAIIAIALCTVSPHLSAQVQPDGTFGFSGSQIFKFNRGVGPLSIVDLDGDGHQDLAVMDNQKAQLVLLFHDPSATGTVPEGGRFEDPDGYRRQEILVNQNVTALAALDVDRDGDADLLLHSPGTLEVRWGGGARPFTEKSRFRTPDTLPGAQSLATHAGETTTEVFLLAKRGVYVLNEFARDRAPKRTFLPESANNPRGLFVLDLDGDRKRDLLTVVEDSTHPYRLRLAQADGGFGSQSIVEASPPLAIAMRSREGATTLLAANRERGRFEELQLRIRGRRDALDFENPDVHPLDAQGLEQPLLATGDIDGDGDPDVLVTDRRDGTILLLKNEKGTLANQPPAPSVRKLGSLAATDLDGAAGDEVVVVSSEERVVGVSRWNGESISFPKKLADVDAPIVSIPGSFTAEDAREVAVLGGADRKTITILGQTGDDWGVRETFKVETNTDPRDLRAYDLDRDGIDEILAFIPYQAPLLYRRADDGGEWARVDAPGTIEAASAAGVTQASNGDLLVAYGNHLRRIRMTDETLEVVYQVNGASGSSQIVAGFEAELQEGEMSLVLIDKGDRTLNIYSTNAAQPRLERSVPGPYQTVVGGTVADLDGNGRDELLLLDPRFLIVIESGGRRPELDRVFTHQCARDQGTYVDVATGDLNGDGVEDVILSEGANHFLEIYRTDSKKQWKLALAFPVYESNSFRSSGRNVGEPRTVRVADVTGDGRDDVILVVHDRVIIYPQDE